MNSRAVMSYLTSRQWAMDPAQLQALAESIALALEKIPADTLKAAQEAAARPKAGARPNADRPLYDLRDGVAHISVSGVILKEVPCIFDLLGMPATSTLAVQRSLTAAVEDEAVKSISLDIDSPGGSLAGVQELADDIAAAASLKPLVAHASDLIASAAYWIGSQASRLTANEAAMVGSIGVYSVIEDASAADAAAGVKVHVLRSSPLKGTGAGDNITPAQLTDQQRIVDEAAAMFTAAVARGRKMSADDAQKVSTGQLWFAAEARERGLIDGIESSADAHAAMAASFTPSLSQTTAPSVGASGEKQMSDTKIPQADAESVDKLKAELAAANAKNAALEANAKALEDQRKEALLGQYRDRIAPAALAGFKQAAAAMSADALESWLKDLPVITRAERVSASGAVGTAKEIVADAGEQQVAKWLGTTPERLNSFEDVMAYRNDGTFEMKDGRILTKDALRKLKGIAAVIAFAVSLGIGAPQTARAALSAARQTPSKWTANIKAYKVKASHTIYAGSLVMIDSTGYAHAAEASASNHGVPCVAVKTVTAAASGIYWVECQEGIFKFNASSISQANVGSLMYASADDTFDETQGTNEPVAGILVEYVSATSGWIYVSTAIQARYYYSATDPLTLTGDLTLSGGGAGALTFTDSAASIVVGDNDTTALDIGSSGNTSLLRLSTGTNAGKLSISGYAGATALAVPVGTVSFTEDLTLAGGAGALTLSDSASSVVLPDNDTSALDIGSTGLLDGVRISTGDNVEAWTFKAGVIKTTKAVTGAVTLDASDCGKTMLVTAGIDTNSITLPAVIDGCELTFVYVGADDGALLDISPNASDGIFGTCTLASSIVTFSGTDDADIGLTKSGGNKGDMIKLVGGTDWYVVACSGIWANN